ncbi:MAG: hypothetical protein E7436_01055 [Ruminococcaceae bacterium]|nr:hypothetical protein [Oscillospiraceae bacterium]
MNLDEYRNRLSPYDLRIFNDIYDCFAGFATQMLLEASTEDDTIIRIIEEYWDIPSSDIELILLDEKIKAALKRLRVFMKGNGYRDSEIEIFMKTNMVQNRLRCEHELLMQWKHPEKIYKAVQKKKKRAGSV